MPNVDLYSQSKNPTPEQLIRACDDLLLQMQNRDSKPPIEEFLSSSEALAEQILGHYGSLPAVASELAGFAMEGCKMPLQVMQVFIYACVRDHASLDTMINEVHAVYGDQKDRTAYAALTGMLQDSSLMLVPRPKLWGPDGKLNHSPIAFYHMHFISYIRELSSYFADGERGVSKILADYPEMDEQSRAMMDENLCKRVYHSMLPDDDPVRRLLQDKLCNVDDCMMRIKRLIDVVDREDDPDGPDTGFEGRFEHVFSLLDSLSTAEVGLVLKRLSSAIKTWMTDEGGFAENLQDKQAVVPRLVRLLERVKPYGFNGLDEVNQHILSETKQSPKLVVPYILDGGLRSEWEGLDILSAWAEAAVIASDDDFLLSLDLDEKHLAILAGHKGSAAFREALQKTDAGRDIVLGQDLGL